MKIEIPLSITAADSNARTISGRIVAFNEPANASTGKVIFAEGSIEPKNVFLNLEHDRTRRIGKTLSMELNPTSQDITATFKIANTTAGSDALVEASEGLKDGFSIELAVDKYEFNEDGTMIVQKGELTGVALVSEPAVRSARVSEVAAVEAEDINENSDSSESDATPTEGEQVDNTASEAPAATEAVEAAQTVQAAESKPVFYTKPRIEVSAAKYLENTIRASMGDESARQYVLAADNTTDNAGLVPTRQLAEVVNGLSTSIRPSIDAISRGTLPDAGMTFEIPKITVAPTVAVVAEDGTFNETDQNSAFISVDVKKFAGQQTFSTEILDRSSPLFFDELMKNMAAALAKVQNSYVSGLLVSNATADGTTTTTYPTAAELLGVMARGAASVYGATAGLPNPFARNIIAGTGQWQNIMTLNDGGRPIYTASQPQNAGGAIAPTSLRGVVGGLDFYVDPSLNSGDADGSLLIVNPDAYTWYEGQTYRLRADVVASGQITVGYYGYGALAVKIAGGAFKNNKA